MSLSLVAMTRSSTSLSKNSFPANSSTSSIRGGRGRREMIWCGAFQRRPSESGKAVDEGMIVLRMRIREAARVTDVAPRDWTEWERKYYVEGYGSDICEGVGLLQSQLMKTRPGFAFAILGLVSLSVPFSVALLLLHLLTYCG